MKASIWSTNDDNASSTIKGSQGHWQGTKPVNGKIVNSSPCYFYYYSRKIVYYTAYSWM